MKKQIFLILVLLTCMCPLAYGQVSVSIGVSVPPPIAFTAPPQLIVLPDTDDVYVCPYLDFDLYFWNGWWWRYWHDRWYYSRYYDNDWLYYDGTPTFYFDVDRTGAYTSLIGIGTAIHGTTSLFPHTRCR